MTRIAADLAIRIEDMIGRPDVLERVDWPSYVSDEIGLATLDDIRRELEKPGRDPRAAFEPPSFRDDVRTVDDLAPGMEIDGIVTNVTAFGAFVDVGVHQDGLVHVSQLADHFVKNPHDVVKVGDRIHVRVLEVDRVRQRIALTAKSM